MQNLSDYSKQNNINSTAKNTNNEQDFNIVNLLNKYGKCSQDELISEFFNQVNKQKQEGTFDKNKITNIANLLLPFLNNEQKNIVLNILNKV